MHKIKIFGDSSCDLSQTILEKYDLEVMPLPVKMVELERLMWITLVY